MAWFSPDYIAFFRELSANNTKDWFDANRKRYAGSVKKPFEAFVAHMIDRVREHDPDVRITARDGIFRINRDIRFSSDKTPYNTSMRAIVSPGGKKDKSYPGLYLQIGAEGIDLYGGSHMLEKDQLAAVRSAIAADPDAFARVIAEPAFVEKWGGKILGERNKRLPKELAEAAEQQPLLYNKSFYYHTNLPAKHITADRLPDLIMEYWHAAAPVKDFLTMARNG